MKKIVLMAMSLRKDSVNKKLIKNTETLLRAENLAYDIEVLQLNDFAMPMYDGDLEVQQGLPDSVQKLSQKISSADAVIFSTPEYNGSIPGTFKNVIDWVSRSNPQPWSGKQILLLGASPGALGAVRGLWHSRVPLEALGAFVYPEMFGLPQAAVAFDTEDQLKDATTSERLKKIVTKFLNRL